LSEPEPAGRALLGERERRPLLALARQAIAARLCLVPVAVPEPAPELTLAGAAFVTLRRRADDELRGCIGTLEARGLLTDVVERMAVAAATQDLRFPCVTAEELPLLAVEISVLTPPVPIAAEQVQPGVHGLIVRAAGRSGLLLPQVATDHGWDRETFLAQTCVKAGLPRDGWKDPRATLLAFTAVVFAEE
jgi:AmmeMemoRadiSam system protein A